MRLPVAADAWLEYEYLIYNKQVPERDYLVDFNVRLVNMAPQMANQASIGIDWSNNSYQNEKGFQNENMYTTISYRFPGESPIEDLGMSEKSKSKSISTSVNWVAFKQQFFFVGVHRPAKCHQRQPGVRYGRSRFGIAEEFFGADDRALYGADRRV